MKVKINKINQVYWYHPTIVTASRKFWHPRAYKNFKTLLQTENLINQNFIISLNGDKDFEMFRKIQTLKGRKVFFNKEQLELIEKEQVIKEIVLKKQNLSLAYDKKSIKAIKRGFIPYYDNSYFLREFSNKKEILWTKNGWKEK